MAVTVTNAAPSTAIKLNNYGAGNFGAVAGAVSVINDSGAFENKRLRLSRLNLSGTYATNGFALVPSAYGLKEIHALMVVGDPNSSSGAAATPQLTTTGASPIVKLYTDNVPTELANTTSVANWTYTVLLAGV